MRKLLGILILVGLFFLAVWVYHFHQVLAHLFYLRIPLLGGIIMLAIPLIARGVLPHMLSNLLVLSRASQLALVIGAAPLMGMAVPLMLNQVLANGPLRFELSPWPLLTLKWQFSIAIILGMPVTVAAICSSTDIAAKKKWLAIGTGAGLGAVLLGCTYLALCFLNAQGLTSVITHILVSMLNDASVGYVHSGQLAQGHLAVWGYFSVTLAVYLYGYYKFQPGLTLKKFQPPILFYIQILLCMLTLFFGSLAFFLDYAHIPVIPLFLIVSYLIFRILKVDHYYRLLPAPEEKKPDPKAFIKALERRLAHQSAEKRTLVVVCVSGGGIQAAGWAIKVLTGLQQLLGPDFTRAIGLISSVSGGSVGMLHYLDHFDSQGYPQDKDKIIFHNAVHNSLDAVGWGIVYPDFWRFMGLAFLPGKYKDRGTAIETNWRSLMKHKTVTFADWRKAIMAGKLPVPVFNATLVENGRRFLLSPMSFGTSQGAQGLSFQAYRRQLFRKCIDFNSLYRDYDILAATAARLSATFPYVSPVCRNSIGKPVFHVTDGGYFDDTGVFTGVEWLNDQILPCNTRLKIKRLLFLEISAFPPPVQSQRALGQGWLMSTIGSILTLLNVSRAIQSVRSRADIENFKKIWSRSIEIANYQIRFPDMHYIPPMSWKLTAKEIQSLEIGWQKLLQNKNSALRRMEKKWRQWGM